MKNLISAILAFAVMFITSCEKNEVFEAPFYSCESVLQDSISLHPKSEIYQGILDKHGKNGMVGAVLLVNDREGLWSGAYGKADIASNIDMHNCNTFLIASISKIFTSAAIYRYIDKGILSLDDPISKYLSATIVDKVKNVSEAQIKHLLAHTSGIADYYTLSLELDRINKLSNDFNKEDVLEYTYGVDATNAVGETYYYSNTNFLLLAMILENASGKSFERVYHEEVFGPLGLQSAYYSEEQAIPDGCVKGYVDIYGNGQYVESEFLYNDELGIGGDGGVAINAFDLATFFEEMLKGRLFSESSLGEMTKWFDLPKDWTSDEDPFGQSENGFGIEKFNTSYAPAVGHTGGIDGFSTIALYFPEEDMTYVLLINSIGNEEGNISAESIFQEVMDEMFE